MSPNPSKIERARNWVQSARHILFITGAGISAESGLPTYRGLGGLYKDGTTEEGHSIEEILSGSMFQERPDLTWKYLRQIEASCRTAQPNDGHHAISQLGQQKQVSVLTQNVDSFHRDAGSHNVIEIHGNLHDIRCTQCTYADRVPHYEKLTESPRCPDCRAPLRPDIVLFGELLPEKALQAYQTTLDQQPDLIVSVGTSALFPYITGPIVHAPAGTRTIDINPETNELTPYVDLHIDGAAGEILPQLLP